MPADILAARSRKADAGGLGRATGGAERPRGPGYGTSARSPTMRRRELMGVADDAPWGAGGRHPRITSRWVQVAVLEARLAFEREMERRRKGLDEEFDRFWRASKAQHA